MKNNILNILIFLFMLGALCDAKSIFGKYLGIDDDSIYFKGRLDRILLDKAKKNTIMSNKKHEKTMEKLNDLFKIKIYYKPVYMTDGTIQYVPHDANKNHYFIG